MKNSIFVACDANNIPVKAFYDRDHAEVFAKDVKDSNGSVYAVALEDLLIENATAALLPVKKPLFHFEITIG